MYATRALGGLLFPDRDHHHGLQYLADGQAGFVHRR